MIDGMRREVRGESCEVPGSRKAEHESVLAGRHSLVTIHSLAARNKTGRFP